MEDRNLSSVIFKGHPKDLISEREYESLEIWQMLLVFLTEDTCDANINKE